MLRLRLGDSQMKNSPKYSHRQNVDKLIIRIINTYDLANVESKVAPNIHHLYKRQAIL